MRFCWLLNQLASLAAVRWPKDCCSPLRVLLSDVSDSPRPMRFDVVIQSDRHQSATGGFHAEARSSWIFHLLACRSIDEPIGVIDLPQLLAGLLWLLQAHFAILPSRRHLISRSYRRIYRRGTTKARFWRGHQDHSISSSPNALLLHLSLRGNTKRGKYFSIKGGQS